MNFFAKMFGFSEPLGKVVYYQTRSQKWRWKVVNANGKTVVNPIKSFPTQIAAQRSFYDVQDIMDSLPNS
ncbi:MAG: hypothetical protein V3V40_06190 [Nitrosomonadaceae bacterium]